MDTENYMTSFMMHLLCERHHAYHIPTLLMMSIESAVLVQTSEGNSLLFSKT